MGRGICTDWRWRRFFWRDGGGKTIYLTGCWLAGTAFGAALTGARHEFLKQNFIWAATLYKEPVATASLVGELQPSGGEFSALLVLGFVWLWRKTQRNKEADLFSSPLFWMIALCWILALKAGRFWRTGIAGRNGRRRRSLTTR